MFPSADFKKVTIRDYLGILARRIWIIVICFFISIIVALVVFFWPYKLYSASATLLVDEHPGGKVIKAGAFASSGGQEDADVMFAQLRSRIFAQRVADKLGREDANELLEMVTVHGADTESKGRRNSDTRVINIVVEGDNPAELAEIANAWVGEIIRSDIQIIDRATVPRTPLPQETNVLVILLMGILVGVGLACLVEYFDASLRTAEEVEFYAEMPFLGYVPTVVEFGRRARKLDKYSLIEPSSKLAESLRNIKVALLFATPEGSAFKTVLVTSSVPGEGKSLVAANLSIVFSVAGEKTLLIDGDIRKGVLSKEFNIMGAKKGLSSVLEGRYSLDEVILSTAIPGLSFIGSGPVVSNPTDLLSTEKLPALMTKLKERYDKIIIDGIPSIIFADDRLLGNQCDGIVYIIKGGSTQLRHVNEGRKKLRDSSAPVLGAVLNKTAPEKDILYYTHSTQTVLRSLLKFLKKRAEEKARSKQSETHAYPKENLLTKLRSYSIDSTTWKRVGDLKKKVNVEDIKKKLNTENLKKLLSKRKPKEPKDPKE